MTKPYAPDAAQNALDSGGHRPIHRHGRTPGRQPAPWSTAAQMKTSALGAAAAEDDGKAETEKRGRKASKETRRQQLIEATIESLARRGYS